MEKILEIGNFGKKIVIVQSKLIGKLGNDYKINFDLFIKPAINVIFRFNKNIYSNEKILIHFTNGKIEYLMGVMDIK